MAEDQLIETFCKAAQARTSRQAAGYIKGIGARLAPPAEARRLADNPPINHVSNILKIRVPDCLYKLFRHITE